MEKRTLQASLHKNTCLEFMQAYQDHDLNKMVQCCDPNGEVFFLPLGEQGGKGKIGELGKAIWASIMECFPDVDNSVDSITNVDGQITFNVHIFGTQAKDFADIPNQGQHFNCSHIFVFEVNSLNKISKIHVNWNLEEFRQQLVA